jgi:hypothetical protein
VLASASRPGKVAPGLYGPWVTCDHMLWGDDFHLNYNFQAAFYVRAIPPRLLCATSLSLLSSNTVALPAGRLGLQPTGACRFLLPARPEPRADRPHERSE